MIRNQWYAILESNEVRRGKPVGVPRMGKSCSRRRRGDCLCCRLA